MGKRIITLADLFCGAGGTSTGAILACNDLGFEPRLTAVNHWPRAYETHSANHPLARHYCATLDSLNPRTLFESGELDILLASPECTNHSLGLGARPVNEISRATAWCVARWAEALLPSVILVENVVQFAKWGPVLNGRPIKHKRGKTFEAWKAIFESLGYRRDQRILCAADYGDPTQRRRLIIQFVRGKRRIVWPQATHAPNDRADALHTPNRWIPVREVIDWSLVGTSINNRPRPLVPKTMARILKGLELFRPEPFLVKYNGTGGAHSLDEPCHTISTRDRFGLVQPIVDEEGEVRDILYRILEPHELAKAMGFPADYRFTGSRADVVKQIGNAVPVNLSRALVRAVLTGEGVRS